MFARFDQAVPNLNTIDSLLSSIDTWSKHAIFRCQNTACITGGKGAVSYAAGIDLGWLRICCYELDTIEIEKAASSKCAAFVS